MFQKANSFIAQVTFPLLFIKPASSKYLTQIESCQLCSIPAQQNIQLIQVNQALRALGKYCYANPLIKLQIIVKTRTYPSTHVRASNELGGFWGIFANSLFIQVMRKVKSYIYSSVFSLHMKTLFTAKLGIVLAPGQIILTSFIWSGLVTKMCQLIMLQKQYLTAE